MIGRKPKRETEGEAAEPRWFDDFDLRLGDVMRGERATLGKSLLDVQRELRIRAAYVAAIENADPSAFDTPGFIAGYVRSYARYLGMDPDKAFAQFCAESGFSTAHGMSSAASSIRKPERAIGGSNLGRADPDPLQYGLGFEPLSDGFLSHVEPRAVGSVLVLATLVAGLGFGGWTLLNEVQRVQVAPVEHTPDVLAELDPLDAATRRDVDAAPGIADAAGVFDPPPDGLDRLYRPRALEEPVMVARDAPISTLDPAAIGIFAGSPGESLAGLVPGSAEAATARLDGPGIPPRQPQVIAEAPKGVLLFAVRPAWVRIRAGDGTVIHEGIMEAGEEYLIPPDVEAPTLQAGMSGSLYFEVGGELFGPLGAGTATVRKLSMAQADLLDRFGPADLARDPELAKVISMAEAETLAPQE